MDSITNPLKDIMIELARETVETVWHKLDMVYDLSGFKCPTIVINPRLKTTAGRSFYTLRKIDLSQSLFCEYPDNFVRDTIPHEVCHQVAWDIFGHGGHGADWQRVMRAYGIEPSRCHTMVNTIWEAQKARR